MVFLSFLILLSFTTACIFLKFLKKIEKIPAYCFQIISAIYLYICYKLGPKAFWILAFYLGFWPESSLPSQGFEEYYLCKQFDLLTFYLVSLSYGTAYCLIFRKVILGFSKKDIVFWILFFWLGFILFDPTAFLSNPTKILQSIYDLNEIHFQVHYLQVIEYFLLNLCFFLTYIFSFLFYFDSFWDSKENKWYTIGLRLLILFLLWSFFSIFLVAPLTASFFLIPSYVEKNCISMESFTGKIFKEYNIPFAEASNESDPCKNQRIWKEIFCETSHAVKDKKIPNGASKGIKAAANVGKLIPRIFCEIRKEGLAECIRRSQEEKKKENQEKDKK